jgi:hypothetical protein
MLSAAGPSGHLEVSLVGGFLDCKGKSEEVWWPDSALTKVANGILSFMHRLPVRVVVRDACLGVLNHLAVPPSRVNLRCYIH